MNKALVALFLGSALFVAKPSEACTEPKDGAGEPTVEPGELGSGEDTHYDTPPEFLAGEEPTIASPLVEISWNPGSDVDADPNKGYFRHAHTIATRVVLRDAISHEIILDELIPQYDYANAKKGTRAEEMRSFVATLEDGAFDVKVQSVYSRHDEVRYGLEGRWQDVEEGAARPAIGESIRGVEFRVASGGCSATGPSSGAIVPVLVVLFFGVTRRRR